MNIQEIMNIKEVMNILEFKTETEIEKGNADYKTADHMKSHQISSEMQLLMPTSSLEYQ